MTSNISRIFLLISLILTSFSCSSSSDSDNPSDDSSDPNDDDDPIDMPIESVIEFEKYYQTNDSTFRFNSIVQSTDSSYALAGIVTGGKNALVKFDKYGNRDWTKVMSNTFTPRGIEKIFLNNDGFIGFRGQDYGSNDDAHIIYFDGNGNIDNEIFFDPNINTLYYDMIRNGDDFLVVGNSEGNISYRMHNSIGDILWEVQQPYNTYAFSVSKLTDGNYVGIGGATTTGNDNYLIKFDDSENIIWTKNHKGLRISAISNNEFLAILNGGNLTKFDQDGNIIWNKTLNNFSDNNTVTPGPLNIITYDNGLIVCSYIRQNSGLNLLVVDQEGNEIDLHSINDGGTATSKTIDDGMVIAQTSSSGFNLIKLSSAFLFD